MTPGAAVRTEPPPTALAALHALAWLVVGNLAGAWLALVRAVPELDDVLAPVTQGRLVPVHLDVHLYGWAALPLVAVLFAYFDVDRTGSALGRASVHAWSAMVAVGAVTWALGGSSGKLFLEWSGLARVTMGLAMAMLAATLLRAAWWVGAPASSTLTWCRRALAVALATVPAVMVWSSGTDVYPSINPDSGGATGRSLLGSSLGIVAVFAATPLLLRLKHGRPSAPARTFALLALHFAAFALLAGGDRSHHEPAQVVGLASIAIWLPLLARHLKPFDWPRAARPWLLATAAWGAAVIVTGLVSFLPGMLERWKFTSSLVGHAHVALAGLVTSWNGVVLVTLGRSGGLSRALERGPAFAAWHAGLGLHVITLFLLGAVEQAAPLGLLPATPLATGLLWARLAAGALQLVASLAWLAGAWRAVADDRAGMEPSAAGAARAA